MNKVDSIMCIVGLCMFLGGMAVAAATTSVISPSLVIFTAIGGIIFTAGYVRLMHPR